MFVWSNALPFAMYSSLGPFATVPAAVFTSWAIQSIEDIGVQLEEPFNVLPLRQYSEGIYAGVDSIRQGYEMAQTNKTTATVTAMPFYGDHPTPINGYPQPEEQRTDSVETEDDTDSEEEEDYRPQGIAA